jgi:uncharacterized protein YebE (UPF0316 family)
MAEWFDVTMLLGAAAIFLARVCDVSIGTVRAIYTIRGQKGVSVALGFLESLIFISAISGVLAGAMSPPKMIAYAGGFACGILVGLMVEGRIASGWWVIRVIGGGTTELAGKLREAGHAITELEGRGKDGPVVILLAVVRRRRAKPLMSLIRREAPKAVVTVESAGSVMNAYSAQGPGGIARRLRPGPVLAASHVAVAPEPAAREKAA